METRQITVTEDKGIKHQGAHYAKGAQTVPVDLARYFCRMGWATCDDPDIENGQRSTKPVAVDPVTLQTRQV